MTLRSAYKTSPIEHPRPSRIEAKTEQEIVVKFTAIVADHPGPCRVAIRGLDDDWKNCVIMEEKFISGIDCKVFEHKAIIRRNKMDNFFYQAGSYIFYTNLEVGRLNRDRAIKMF